MAGNAAPSGRKGRVLRKVALTLLFILLFYIVFSTAAALIAPTVIFARSDLSAEYLELAFSKLDTERSEVRFLSGENELRGFQIAIRDGGLKGLMTAFNRLGCTHVAAHQGLMNGILEGEWGYRGFTMTDSVKSSQYFLPRETILAANHQMLGGSNNGAVWGLTVDEVSKDPALQNALRETYRRKLYVYVNSAVLNGITPESAASSSLVWWALMLRIIMGLRFVGFVVYAVRFFLRERKERSM